MSFDVAELSSAAERNQNSISEEIEQRIERSFLMDNVDASIRNIGDLVALELAHSERRLSAST